MPSLLLINVNAMLVARKMHYSIVHTFRFILSFRVSEYKTVGPYVSFVNALLNGTQFGDV